MQPAPDVKPDPACARPLDALKVVAADFGGELWANQFGFWRLDVERDQIQWSNDWCERLGIDPCIGPNHVACWNAQIHPDDITNICNYALPAAHKAQVYEAEYRLRTVAGEWRWVLSRGRIAEVNARGGPRVIVGLTIDIDDRKRAQLALQEREQQLALSVWGGAVGLWDWDFANDRCRWLNDWCQTHDIDECSSHDHVARWKANVHPDDRWRMDKVDDEFSVHGRDSYEYEYRHRTRRGEWRWLLERGRVAARADDGRVTRITGVCIDVTLERHNEHKLREYQERYFAVVQRIPGYVFELRPSLDGLAAATWASDGLEKVFGVDLKTYNELGGWSRFGFAEDYERNIENRRALLRGESTEQHWHVRNIHGEHRWLHAFYTPFLDRSSGKVDMILGVAHDVTERVLLERQVLDATHQEQQRIANDLHDGLGQELTGIALMLQSMVPSLRDMAPNQTQQLETAIALVREAISNTRSIAHGLAPIAAAPGAFVAALRMLARNTLHADSAQVRVQTTGDAQVTVPVELATQLYRIAQEAVSNALRHSGAKRIEIALDIGADRATLAITDDGSGIDANLRRSAGRGLQTIAYRADVIGATLEVTSAGPRGTRIRCTFPMPQTTAAAR